jgi:hypothetical protein
MDSQMPVKIGRMDVIEGNDVRRAGRIGERGMAGEATVRCR